jgi:hypothetical protein
MFEMYPNVTPFFFPVHPPPKFIIRDAIDVNERVSVHDIQVKSLCLTKHHAMKTYRVSGGIKVKGKVVPVL